MSTIEKKITKYFVFFFIANLFFTSCVTQRNVEYLQDRDRNVKEFKTLDFQDYKLKPNDDIMIQISSLDDAGGANVFSNPNRQGNSVSMDQFAASLLSHTIDKDGYLDYPVIGKFLVKDKTIAQVSAMLKESLVNVLNQPVVSIKLINRFVSVLGEVRNPGHFPYAQDKLSIYDAIGLAGDISDYGNRSNVILIRNENGKNIRVNLNLTKSGILESDYYFLRPNDILYVKPARKKFWGMKEFPFSILLSSISTAIVVVSYLNTIKK